MSDAEVLDGTVIDTSDMDHPAPRQVHGPSNALEAITAPRLAVTPEVDATELVARLDVIREAMDTAMKPDVDYGVIPGTGSKPTLLKPGAEKLGVLFQLDVQIVNEKIWGPDGHLTVSSLATVFHAPTGARLGFGEGLCSTREKKYGRRKQERTCPQCGKAAVIKGKAEYGGGWLCFKKKDGCGAKWNDGDQALESQAVGEIDNPDLPDTWNTVIKMAEKRARVDAILAVTGASALFTQDAEDLAGAAPVVAPVELPAHAVEASAEAKAAAAKALHAICYGDEAAVDECWQQITARLGGMPAAATYAISAAYRSMLAASPVPGGDGASGEAQAGDSPTAAPDAQEPLL